MGEMKRIEPELRSVQVTQSAPNFLEVFGLSGTASVSMEEALGVPAVWSAVNFLSGTIAGLPLHVYDKNAAGKKRVKHSAVNPFVAMLHDAVNEGMSSFDWRFQMMNAVLTEGRFVTYIERDSRGNPINLFPLPNATVERLENGRKQYKYRVGTKPAIVYDQAEVLDVPFMLKPDLLNHRSPLRQCSVAIGKAVNANEYGSKLFKNGGLPAFVLQGPFGTEKSAIRASDNISQATKEAARKGANVLAIPQGHELKPLGSDPDKMQLVEAQSLAVLEVARIYGLPPTFLQDLTHGTFSNTEQQDLHFVKHTMKRWLEQLEAEMNLKFFGRGSKRVVEFNVDGLLRGDYLTRMDGNSKAIQTGQLTPNEARALENREPLPGGDGLMIQGATVPLDGHTGESPPQEGAQDEP